MTLSSSETKPESDDPSSAEMERTERTSAVTPRLLTRILSDGLTFGKYRVVRLMAIGGMSEIYEAVHIALNKRVALKVMRRDLAENPTARQRFISEGVNAARLRHTNVVDVTDVGEVDELPFLVMALLDGEDLGRVYDRQGRIGIPEIIDLLLPVASAVAVGHEKGVVHRDLKPDNIFLHREGARVIPKVLDFGVSRVLTARRITLNSSVFGTPHYMSPEQARGGPTDARTDQYSFGVILYEGVTGRLPRDSPNPIELLHAVAYDSFRPPSDFFEVPPELETVILRAMASEPALRFDTMRDLALALLPFASESAREYWSLELAASVVERDLASLPQTARHPSPTPAALARLSSPAVRLQTGPLSATMPAQVPARVINGHARPQNNGIVIARPTARPAPPPPPPARPRTAAATARLIASNRARALELAREAAAQRDTKRRKRMALAAGVGGLVIGLAAFGIWFSRRGPEVPMHATGTRDDNAQYFEVEVQTVPSTATIEIDGQSVAVGQYSARLRRDSVEHELLVHAPGWVDSRVKFRDEAPRKLVQLERVPEYANSNPQPESVASSSQPTAAKASHGLARRPPAGAARTQARADGAPPAAQPSERVQPTAARSEASASGGRARDDSSERSAPRVAIPSDSDKANPHIAVVEPARPRVRIVDEFEPRVRLVE
jgi:serine/threonine protein kinase